MSKFRYTPEDLDMPSKTNAFEVKQRAQGEKEALSLK